MAIASFDQSHRQPHRRGMPMPPRLRAVLLVTLGAAALLNRAFALAAIARPDEVRYATRRCTAVVWLTSAWLLLRYGAAVPSAARSVWALLLMGFWAGNLATLPGANTLAPWGAFAALVGLAGLWRLYRGAPTAAAARSLEAAD